jgi:hypothetical protein
VGSPLPILLTTLYAFRPGSPTKEAVYLTVTSRTVWQDTDFGRIILIQFSHWSIGFGSHIEAGDTCL